MKILTRYEFNQFNMNMYLKLGHDNFSREFSNYHQTFSQVEFLISVRSIKFEYVSNYSVVINRARNKLGTVAIMMNKEAKKKKKLWK